MMSAEHPERERLASLREEADLLHPFFRMGYNRALDDVFPLLRPEAASPPEGRELEYTDEEEIAFALHGSLKPLLASVRGFVRAQTGEPDAWQVVWMGMKSGKRGVEIREVCPTYARAEHLAAKRGSAIIVPLYRGAPAAPVDRGLVERPAWVDKMMEATADHGGFGMFNPELVAMRGQGLRGFHMVFKDRPSFVLWFEAFTEMLGLQGGEEDLGRAPEARAGEVTT